MLLRWDEKLKSIEYKMLLALIAEGYFNISDLSISQLGVLKESIWKEKFEIFFETYCILKNDCLISRDIYELLGEDFFIEYSIQNSTVLTKDPEKILPFIYRAEKMLDVILDFRIFERLYTQGSINASELVSAEERIRETLEEIQSEKEKIVLRFWYDLETLEDVIDTVDIWSWVKKKISHKVISWVSEKAFWKKIAPNYIDKFLLVVTFLWLIFSINKWRKWENIYEPLISLFKFSRRKNRKEEESENQKEEEKRKKKKKTLYYYLTHWG